MLFARAEDALAHRVNLLGSGLAPLGDQIDWHTDFKTGIGWSPRYFADIDYNNPDRPSDVKVPWELSRLQWLMPVGQVWVMTRDERYAEAVKSVLEQWIDANPCGGSVNWSCTMEAALRVFTWTWFFHIFKDAASWNDPAFRFRFLRALYLHVEFTDRHIERSDVNGNHYTADAAALVVGGLFFGEGEGPTHWQQEGWRILVEEMPRQVFPDGVDFEASVPYHRLVAELFLWPAMHRTAHGLPVDDAYRQRLLAMGRFAKAYTKPNGQVPLWGDADDARALPLGMQSINDHRYLPALIGAYLGGEHGLGGEKDGLGELFWVRGPDAVAQWRNACPQATSSEAFPDGGFYVLRGAVDHVFIDCGPLGLAGRGGHGHNDCLSFEVVLDGTPLVSDCGAYLYTASYEERNRFRSTDLHNTPRVDAEELNRFIRPDYLWNLHNDALPRALVWHDSESSAGFAGAHSGFERLSDPVTPHRAWHLDKVNHALVVMDRIVGRGSHLIEIPLHLAPGVEVVSLACDHAILESEGRRFRLDWHAPDALEMAKEPARVSPSYGTVIPTTRLVWRGRLGLPLDLAVVIAPVRVQASAAALIEAARKELAWP
ncbi:heparinase II/III family protein [Hydrogenophaga sp. XSHU_21]